RPSSCRRASSTTPGCAGRSRWRSRLLPSGALANAAGEARLQRGVAGPRLAVDAEDPAVPVRALRPAAPLVEVPARDLRPVLLDELERVADRSRRARLVVAPPAAE